VCTIVLQCKQANENETSYRYFHICRFILAKHQSYKGILNKDSKVWNSKDSKLSAHKGIRIKYRHNELNKGKIINRKVKNRVLCFTFRTSAHVNSFHRRFTGGVFPLNLYPLVPYFFLLF
jgi:hypothetical protein